MKRFLDTAKKRRRAWRLFIVLMVGPGAFFTYYWSGSIAWANFQSWLALVIAAFTGLSAETPVEDETTTHQVGSSHRVQGEGAS